MKRNKRCTSLPSDDYFDDDESPDFLPADQDSTDDEDSSFELDKFIRQRKLSKIKPKQKALVRTMKPKKGVLADVTNLEESEPITDPKTQLKQKPRTNNPKKRVLADVTHLEKSIKPVINVKNEGKKCRMDVMDKQAKELISAAKQAAEQAEQTSPPKEAKTDASSCFNIKEEENHLESHLDDLETAGISDLDTTTKTNDSCCSSVCRIHTQKCFKSELE